MHSARGLSPRALAGFGYREASCQQPITPLPTKLVDLARWHVANEKNVAESNCLNLHVDHLTFRRIVMTLHMCDSIIEESESGKNTLYTIKNAA